MFKEILEKNGVLDKLDIKTYKDNSININDSDVDIDVRMCSCLLMDKETTFYTMQLGETEERALESACEQYVIENGFNLSWLWEHIKETSSEIYGLEKNTDTQYLYYIKNGNHGDNKRFITFEKDMKLHASILDIKTKLIAYLLSKGIKFNNDLKGGELNV